MLYVVCCNREGKSKMQITKNYIAEQKNYKLYHIVFNTKISNIEKGKIGEEIIVNHIKKEIDIYHKIIQNVILTRDGKKTEVDIILITCVGIYVIESKNFKGYIYGTDTGKIWTEWFSHSYKYHFDNPILQNHYHIEFMAHNLNRDLSYFHSYIVFGDDAILQKIVMQEENKTKAIIINNKDLISKLIEDMHLRDIILSHEEIDKMYLDLKYFYSHLER